MSNKNVGFSLVVAGVIIGLFFAFADVIVVGNPARFGYIQIIGTVVGVLTFVVGIIS